MSVICKDENHRKFWDVNGDCLRCENNRYADLEHQLALAREGLETIINEIGCIDERGQTITEKRCSKIAQQTLAKLSEAKK